MGVSLILLFAGGTSLSHITILGRDLPIYGLLAVLGFIACLLYLLYEAKKYAFSFDEAFDVFLYAIIGGAIGGKLLYSLQHVQELFQHSDMIFRNFETFTAYFFSGFVFYGGLIGAITGAFLYARRFHIDIRSYLPYLIPLIPLFHAIARIGCFLGGCCYGIEMQPPLGIWYHSTAAIPVEAYRFPVQLYEAGGNLVLWCILIYMVKRQTDTIHILAGYGCGYAVLRFVLEFLRGDAIRGIYILSTSQWISIAILILCVWMLRYKQTALRIFNQEKKEQSLHS